VTAPPGRARTIVCAVDDSHRAPPVARAGAWLARELDARLLLVSIFDPMAIAVALTKEMRLAGTTPEHVVDVERARVGGVLGTTALALAGTDHTAQLVEGQVVPELLRLTREHDARLLITGRDARTPLERMMDGSVSSDLAAAAPCPVVVVTENAVLDEPGPVVVAFDGSDDSLRAVRHGAVLAERLGRSLVLVYVVAPGVGDPSDDDIEARLQDAARDCEQGSVDGLQGCIADVTLIVDHGDPVDRITSAARDHAAPLLVIGTRGSGAVGDMLLGSISAGVVCGAGRPVVLAGPRS
jgi:nucleotide-binding universal stress UspA family protein